MSTMLLKQKATESAYVAAARGLQPKAPTSFLDGGRVQILSSIPEVLIG